MTFTMLNADMSIIQKLADNPTETAVGDIPAVVDNLTSTSAADALSANQGRALNTALSGKQKTITAGTGTPSGGSNGDIYIKYI